LGSCKKTKIIIVSQYILRPDSATHQSLLSMSSRACPAAGSAPAAPAAPGALVPAAAQQRAATQDRAAVEDMVCAVMQGKHDRLGSSSPLRVLPLDICKYIADAAATYVVAIHR
jgi:hypothetical protein